MDKLLKWRKNYMYPPQSDQTKHLWVAKFGWREGDFHALPLMTGFYNLFHNIPQKTQVVKIGFELHFRCMTFRFLPSSTRRRVPGSRRWDTAAAGCPPSCRSWRTPAPSPTEGLKQQEHENLVNWRSNDMYRARKNGLQNVISTTQAGPGRLVYTVIHLLVVEVSCVLFWTHSVCMVSKQNARNIYHKQMNNGVE